MYIAFLYPKNEQKRQIFLKVSPQCRSAQNWRYSIYDVAAKNNVSVWRYVSMYQHCVERQ